MSKAHKTRKLHQPRTMIMCRPGTRPTIFLVKFPLPIHGLLSLISPSSFQEGGHKVPKRFLIAYFITCRYFLWFLVIDVSWFGLQVILPPSFGLSPGQFQIYEPKLNKNQVSERQNLNHWPVRPILTNLVSFHCFIQQQKNLQTF